MQDDDLNPHLGRMGRDGSSDRYLTRVMKAARRIGGSKQGRVAFEGSRIGRGASKARSLRLQNRFNGLHSRRVIVKFRTIKLKGIGLGAAKAHLRYIERDGTGRDGENGYVYSADKDQADGAEFLKRSAPDRHQFRMIISPEDADQYRDLKSFVRRLMSQMECDLGSKLDWIAVDHFNTAHPHSHIMMRGRSDCETDLVIAPEYISHGVRTRAIEILNLDLGPRSEQEIKTRLDREVSAERLTSLDRAFIKEARSQILVQMRAEDPEMQTRRTGRLQKLARLGLAEPMGSDRWRLHPDIAQTLTKMGERGDIIRTMQRELAARNLIRSGSDHSIVDPEHPNHSPIVGKLVARGLSSEFHDRHFLLIDGIDGRVHYVDIGRAQAVDPMPENAIVQLKIRDQGPRRVDQNIIDVARSNSGRYSLEAHLRYDPSAREEYAQTHVRRLEAMRRRLSSLEREPSGAWIIKPDHSARVEAFEKLERRDRPVDVRILSPLAVEHLPTLEAATWLDEDLSSSQPLPLRDAGFGREVRAALSLRRQWLMDEGLGDFSKGCDPLPKEILNRLTERELHQAATKIAAGNGKSFRALKIGDQAEGKYIKPVHLVSGKFALLENSKEFSLAPWRPVLERQIGKQISGIVREGGINWRFGRERGGPSLS